MEIGLEKVQRDIAGLNQEGFVGRTYFLIWRAVESFRSKHPQLYEQTERYFVFSLVALYYQAILNITKLLDSDGNSVNIEKLLRTVRKVSSKFKQPESEILDRLLQHEKALKEVQRKAKPLIDVRNNLIAHLSDEAVNDPDKASSLMSSFNATLIDELFLEAREIVDYWNGICGGGDLQWEVLEWEDCNWLMKLAERGRIRDGELREAVRNGKISPDALHRWDEIE